MSQLSYQEIESLLENVDFLHIIINGNLTDIPELDVPYLVEICFFFVFQRPIGLSKRTTVSLKNLNIQDQSIREKFPYIRSGFLRAISKMIIERLPLDLLERTKQGPFYRRNKCFYFETE